MKKKKLFQYLLKPVFLLFVNQCKTLVFFLSFFFLQIFPEKKLSIKLGLKTKQTFFVLILISSSRLFYMTIQRCQYRIPSTPVDRVCILAHNAQPRTRRYCCLCCNVCVYLHLDAEHISDASHAVHEHVQQTMILSTDESIINRAQGKQSAHKTPCSAPTVGLNQSLSRAWWRSRGSELSADVDGKSGTPSSRDTRFDSARSDLEQRWKPHEAEVAHPAQVDRAAGTRGF